PQSAVRAHRPRQGLARGARPRLAGSSLRMEAAQIREYGARPHEPSSRRVIVPRIVFRLKRPKQPIPYRRADAVVHEMSTVVNAMSAFEPGEPGDAGDRAASMMLRVMQQRVIVVSR